MAGSGLLLPALPGMAAAAGGGIVSYAGHPLLAECDDLLRRWCAGMLALQVNKPGQAGLHGALLCPACGAIHGRCADAIFPFLLMAEKTGDRRYVNASLELYNWMEHNTSLPDGAWLNEITVSAWKGTTVFTVIVLAESLLHFGRLLDPPTKKRWTERLRKACEYIYREFNIKTGNINYPVAASYALSLAGGYLHEQKYVDRGRALAHDSLAWFSPKDKWLYGEGHPVHEPSARGRYSVDLGYNVEESLPSLVLYGRLMKDEAVLDAVTASMKTHLEFMLPDGGWDNSWGTRNYKWTWWGSRTSDGCQPAFALMADREPVFYKAALLNTRLLKACTHNNLLYGGLHNIQHEVKPCIHHTFSHSKALATILVKKAPAPSPPLYALTLPRQQEYGIKTFPEIGVALLSRYNWLATVTTYDQEYVMKSGHASGGALSLLWRPDTGPLIAAGMNKYQLQEGFNMQADTDPRSICLTPRFEWQGDNGVFTNINDLTAEVESGESDRFLFFLASSRLVNENQQPAPLAATGCAIHYTAAGHGAFIIEAECYAPADGKLKYIFPLIVTRNEKITIVSPTELVIHKPAIKITVTSSTPMHLPLDAAERIFNFVPGVEAFPIELPGNKTKIELRPG